MKKILLLSAAYLNGGAYVDAGAQVPIGTEKLEMTEERAAGMIAGKLAEELPDDEQAGDDVGRGDGLDALKLDELKAIAVKEEADVSQARSKVDFVAAIRAKRGQ